MNTEIFFKTENKDNFYKNCVKVKEHNGFPIFLWFISFKSVFINPKKYADFFGSNIIDFLLKSSGAISFKGENSYGIIINNDNFYKFNEVCKNFIISHEIGHIVNGDFENSNYIYQQGQENEADNYAKQQGFKLWTSPFKLTMWEIYSLIPECPYIKKCKTRMTRFRLFLKHLFPNIIRIIKNI